MSLWFKFVICQEKLTLSSLERQFPFLKVMLILDIRQESLVIALINAKYLFSECFPLNSPLNAIHLDLALFQWENPID